MIDSAKGGGKTKATGTVVSKFVVGSRVFRVSNPGTGTFPNKLTFQIRPRTPEYAVEALPWDWCGRCRCSERLRETERRAITLLNAITCRVVISEVLRSCPKLAGCAVSALRADDTSCIFMPRDSHSVRSQLICQWVHLSAHQGLSTCLASDSVC